MGLDVTSQWVIIRIKHIPPRADSSAAGLGHYQQHRLGLDGSTMNFPFININPGLASEEKEQVLCVSIKNMTKTLLLHSVLLLNEFKICLIDLSPLINEIKH